MRLYELEEFDSLHTTTGDPIPGDDILAPGTVVSVVLHGMQTHACASVTTRRGLRLDPTLTSAPQLPSREELFFRVVDYAPPPEDRYTLQLLPIPGGVYAPPVEHIKELTVVVNDDLRRELLEDDLYTASAAPKRKAKHALLAQLQAGSLTHKEFCAQLASAKRAAAAGKAAVLDSGRYAVGSTVQVQCVCSSSERCVSRGSVFLQPPATEAAAAAAPSRHRISAKRKNIHYVRGPCGGPPTHVRRFLAAALVTTWGGQLLQPSVRSLVGVGNTVRACWEHVSGTPSVSYFAIVRVLEGNRLEGVGLPWCCIEHALPLAGTYQEIPRASITEIPDWLQNADIAAAVRAARQAARLAVTGTTAIGDSGAGV